MSIRNEIDALMKDNSVLFEVAEKVEYKRDLTAEEKEIAEISDEWAKEIGRTGKDPDCTIAEFINRTVNEELYNTPDELLAFALFHICSSFFRQKTDTIDVFSLAYLRAD